MKCGGPEGCTKVGDEDQCAQSSVQEKDVCNLASDFTCRADGAALMTCTNNRWAFAQGCAGDRKCSIEGKKVTCDNSLAKLDDVCREENDYACAVPDLKSALVCRGGKFVLASHCKGPKACRITGEKATGFKVECDDSIAVEGDPCDKEGHYACAADGKRILACKEKRYAGDDRCKAKEKCMVKGGMVGCYR